MPVKAAEGQRSEFGVRASIPAGYPRERRAEVSKSHARAIPLQARSSYAYVCLGRSLAPFLLKDRMTEIRAQAPPLLPRVARGEADAVEACIARYSPLVWTLARRLSRDMSSIEDLVQEIFIDIWKSAGRFDPGQASEATFIAVIARRRVIDRQRQIARTAVHESVDETSVSQHEAGYSEVDLGDEARRAQEVLAKLKPEQRRVILMSVVDGLTHQEISSRTNIPLGTVKSHIRRGIEQTAQTLRGEREGKLP